MHPAGVLLIQLGTPDAPTDEALRPYLRQFLSDPRVIDVPRWKWWWVLNLGILPRRPAQSAAKYARIWDKVNGSPLLYYSRRQVQELRRHPAVRPALLRAPRLPRRRRCHRPRAAGPAGLAAGSLRPQLPRHPDPLRQGRRPLRAAGQADDVAAGQAPRLAPRAVDAVVP